MSSIDEYYRKECEKISASDVNAYLELKLDDREPNKLILDSSWGETEVDLTDAVKTAETVTHMYLSPAQSPVSLQYDPERGQPDCITGDALSRIISLTKLKDVDQNTAPTNGDVYMYNNGKWYTFNLEDALEQLDLRITNGLANLLQQINQLRQEIAPPAGIPDNARIMYGNINIYSDYTNGNVRDWGVFAHNVSNDIANDEFFA